LLSIYFGMIKKLLNNCCHRLLKRIDVLGRHL
jgi:hypothetical protein